MSRSRPPRCPYGRGCPYCVRAALPRHELTAPTIAEGLEEYEQERGTYGCDCEGCTVLLYLDLIDPVWDEGDD